MLKESQTPRYAVRRTHRTYSPQFKSELVAACQQPGASIAALAMLHGMNANVLHRWLKEYEQGRHRLLGASKPLQAVEQRPVSTPAFLPIELKALAPSCDVTATPDVAHDLPVPAATATVTSIHLECQRQGTSVTVHWPLSAAAQCTQLLREWLG